MGCEGSFIFQGHQMGVTMEFKEVVALFMNGIHCFAHKMNLAMIILSDLPFVHRLECVLYRTCIFFVHSLKKFLEFEKLENLINTKKQVITKCENLLDFYAFPIKMVYVKYRFIIVKMHSESSKSDKALMNFNAMCDVELILGLLYILPLFECVHTVTKIAQGRNVLCVTLWRVLSNCNKSYTCYIVILTLGLII
jgi:hypothetical protein